MVYSQDGRQLASCSEDHTVQLWDAAICDGTNQRIHKLYNAMLVFSLKATLRNKPLWAAQSQRFECQKTLWNEASTTGEMQIPQAHAERFLEDEAQSLEDRYCPHTDTAIDTREQLSRSRDLNLMIERCSQFDGLVSCSTLLLFGWLLRLR